MEKEKNDFQRALDVIKGIDLFREKFGYTPLGFNSHFIKEISLLGELVDKTVPMNVITKEKIDRCASCESMLNLNDIAKRHIRYCYYCGQAIDWSKK